MAAFVTPPSVDHKGREVKTRLTIGFNHLSKRILPKQKDQRLSLDLLTTIQHSTRGAIMAPLIPNHLLGQLVPSDYRLIFSDENQAMV